MIIIPGNPPLQQTRHSSELGRRVEQLVRDYQREHPDVTEGDVRTALAQLTSELPQDNLRRNRVLGAVLAALGAGLFGIMASTGGQGFANNPMVFKIVGVAAAVLGVTFAAIRIARRS